MRKLRELKFEHGTIIERRQVDAPADFVPNHDYHDVVGRISYADVNGGDRSFGVGWHEINGGNRTTLFEARAWTARICGNVVFLNRTAADIGHVDLPHRLANEYIRVIRNSGGGDWKNIVR